MYNTLEKQKLNTLNTFYLQVYYANKTIEENDEVSSKPAVVTYRTFLPQQLTRGRYPRHEDMNKLMEKARTWLKATGENKKISTERNVCGVFWRTLVTGDSLDQDLGLRQSQGLKARAVTLTYMLRRTRRIPD